MTKKQEQEAISSLEKLDELTKDILCNSTNGGDANFRQIVFSGLTHTKNPILIDKMKELLFVDNEEDLKKTIILGIFIHKEMFEPVLEYGEKYVNMPYIDESYDNKESFLFVLDALMELAYKNKINNFESGISLLIELLKIASSAQSTSILADKLLQRFLNSKIGTVKTLQPYFLDLITDDLTENNVKIISTDILARSLCTKLPDTIKSVLQNINNETIIENIELLDVFTLALTYFQNKKYTSKIKQNLKLIETLNFKNVKDNEDTVKRIKKRIEKLKEIVA